MAEMESYNESAACTKCGGLDIGTSYHSGNSCSYICPMFFITDKPEHMLRYCRNCHYQWVESPLDWGI